MPIYEYECTECDHVTEAIQKFSDRPLTRCKSCGGKLHKLISHSSFHLKGSGWYVTDYAGKKDSGTKPPAKKNDSSPASDKKTSSKGDSDT